MYGHRPGEARIDRIAGGGIERHAGDAHLRTPRFAGVDPLRQLARVELFAEEAVDRPREMRKRIHVVGLLEDLAIDHRGIDEVLGTVVRREARDGAVEPLEHRLEDVVAAERTLHADRHDQPRLDHPVVKLERIVISSGHR